MILQNSGISTNVPAPLMEQKYISNKVLIPVTGLKTTILSQNKVFHNNNNNNNNDNSNNKEDNNINTGTIPFPNTSEIEF